MKTDKYFYGNGTLKLSYTSDKLVRMICSTIKLSFEYRHKNHILLI